MSSNLLLIDIGNTSVTMGVSNGNRIVRRGSILTRNTYRANVANAIEGLVKGLDFSGAVLSSVVPSKNPVWVEMIRKSTGTKPMIVSHKLNLGLGIEYPKPDTIGADRLVNASAAIWLYGKPAIIADFGTALTFDVINKRGAYCGGVIAPGLPLMMDYLYDRTELLPRIGIKGKVLGYGRSTEDAMRVGAKVGYAGMVKSITEHMLASLDGQVKLVATGGYAKHALSLTGLPYVINPNLTLLGLRRIFLLNQQ